MKKIDIDIIPLAIAAILILVTIVVVSTSNYVLSLKHYIGFASILISTFLYFKNREIYFLVFGLTLLVGIFGGVGFYYSAFEIGFGGFGIDLISIVLLILHGALVFKMAEKMDNAK